MSCLFHQKLYDTVSLVGDFSSEEKTTSYLKMRKEGVKIVIIRTNIV